VLPIETLVRELAARGVDTLVDGAHAPGMVPLAVKRIGAAYYAGNCHKWLCAPKGAGFLYVRPDRQPGLQPPVISHGYNSARPGHTRLQDAFDWPGTDDPTAWICVGEAIGFLSGLVEGGLDGLMRRNRELTLAARRMLSDRLGLSAVCPEEMIGSMAAVRLPDDPDPGAAMDPTTPTPSHRHGTELLRRFGIDVPVYYWPEPPRLLLRVSAQAYNSLDQYERLADALAGLL
jgi:isopenicillin-N epimerase